MKFGVLTRNRNSWSSTQLQMAMEKCRIACECFSIPQLVAHVGHPPNFRVANGILPEQLDALIVRPVGRGSVEELVFGMDVLYRLERLGLCVINPPEAIEHCVDKYDVLTFLEESGMPVPRTAVTENVGEALKAFKELGGDVVVKPLFGSRGVGSTRIRDPEVASTVFRAITFYRGVLYIQEFVHHGVSDVRVFVIGDRAAAAMKRVAIGWKTNYSQGARPEPIKLSKSLEDMAVRSAGLVGCKVAGVDILESTKGPMVIEVNSQPGWKGLQSITKTNIAEEIIDFVVSELRK